MKYYLPIAIVLFSVTNLALGNLYVPKAKLAGETVYARLDRDACAVTAVLEFEEWDTRDAKVIYFPIVAKDVTDPIKVLAAAEIEIEVGNKKLGIATPCEAPVALKTDVKGAHILWFAADLHALLGENDEIELLNSQDRITIRFSYKQQLVNNCFYYLPIIVGQPPDVASSWKYQMFARSIYHIVRVASKGTNHVRMEDAEVVYLKDREIVQIR